MDGYKHYIRVNEQGIVIYAFSSAFLRETGGSEEIMTGDICVNEDGGRHYNPTLIIDGEYIYKYVNGQMVERTQDADFQLQAAKRQKIAELDAACAIALQTFPSSALGAPHTYLSGLQDMVLLSAEYSFVSGPDYDNQPIIWYTVEAGNVSHTKAQFVQAYLDGRRHIADTKYRLASLEPQVDAITDVTTGMAQVQVIVW